MALPLLLTTTTTNYLFSNTGTSDYFCFLKSVPQYTINSHNKWLNFSSNHFSRNKSKSHKKTGKKQKTVSITLRFCSLYLVIQHSSKHSKIHHLLWTNSDAEPATNKLHKLIKLQLLLSTRQFAGISAEFIPQKRAAVAKTSPNRQTNVTIWRTDTP